MWVVPLADGTVCALSPQIVDIVSTILIYHSQGQRFGQDSIQDTVSVDMNQTFVGPAEIGDVLVIETFLLRRLVRLPRPLRLGPCTFRRWPGRPGGREVREVQVREVQVREVQVREVQVRGSKLPKAERRAQCCALSRGRLCVAGQEPGLYRHGDHAEGDRGVGVLRPPHQVYRAELRLAGAANLPERGPQPVPRPLAAQVNIACGC